MSCTPNNIYVLSQKKGGGEYNYVASIVIAIKLVKMLDYTTAIQGRKQSSKKGGQNLFVFDRALRIFFRKMVVNNKSL